MRFLLIFAFYLVLVGCDRSETIKSEYIAAVSDLEVNPLSELKTSIQNQNFNIFKRAINQLKRDRLDSGAYAYLVGLWETEAVDDFVRSPDVRIELANILVQAINNGRIKRDVEEFRSYAQTLVASDDDALASDAILVLGLVGAREDVAGFRKIIDAEHEGTFYSASAAFSRSCHVNPADYYDVVQNIVDNELKSEFEKIWTAYESLRGSFCK